MNAAPSRRKWLASQYRWHKRQAEHYRRQWEHEVRAERISAPLFKKKEKA